MIALLALLIVFFPWDVLRGPVNRYVSEKTGRHFEITRKLDVKVGRTTRILADGIEFANPEWAKDPHPGEGRRRRNRRSSCCRCSHRRIELPLVELRKPQLGLQVEADGRRSWALGRDTATRATCPTSARSWSTRAPAFHRDGARRRHPYRLRDRGPLARHSRIRGTQAAAAMPPMPTFNAKGTWQKEAFTAKGRTGNVLYLSAPLQHPSRMEVECRRGRDDLRARGAIASLATLDGADAVFDLQGRDLADLYKLVGVVLPATPRYSVRGHWSKQGEVWNVQGHQRQAGPLRPERRAVLRQQQRRAAPGRQRCNRNRSISMTSRRWSACPTAAQSRRRAGQCAGSRDRQPGGKAQRAAQATPTARCCRKRRWTWRA